MSLTDDDAKEIIKTLASRKDNAHIIIAGFIATVLTFFLVILAITNIFKPKTSIYADFVSFLFFIVASVACIGGLHFYSKNVAIKNKLNEVLSKHHNLEEFYVGIFPEEQKILKVRIRQAGVLSRLRVKHAEALLRLQQFFGVVFIIVGVVIVWRSYVLFTSSYLSPQSSMAGLNIIIVPLETIILYIVGLLLFILGLFMVFGKDRVLNCAQKIKIA